MARVIMFHKPRGLVVTLRDERGRRTVYDALPAWVRGHGLRAVGRLDQDSRGLLLFTDDGKLAERLLRPGGHLKTYEVWVRGRVTEEHRGGMLRGVKTASGVMKAAAVELRGGAGPKSRLVVTLAEGKNRQIRRMLGALTDPQRGTPLKVLELKRTGFGPLQLDIASGQWRELTPDELAALRADNATGTQVAFPSDEE